MKFSIDSEQRMTNDPATLLTIVDHNIEVKDWLTSWSILNGVIYEFPEYGPAYNYKGWLCVHVLKAYEEAKEYFELAIKYSPDYQPTYVNYASLLNTLDKYQELEELIKKALLIEGIDKVNLYSEWGLLYEKTQNFDQAIESYLEAIKYSLHYDEISLLEESMNRCTSKKNILTLQY